MAVTLAPAALARVRGYLAETPDAIGLRFGVKRTGCSGWGYVADLAKEAREGDTVFGQDGVRMELGAAQGWRGVLSLPEGAPVGAAMNWSLNSPDDQMYVSRVIVRLAFAIASSIAGKISSPLTRTPSPSLK